MQIKVDIMHEFSIAMSIVDLANEYAEKENATKIMELEIAVGELSGVVIEALEFALESAVQGTILEFANIRIEEVKGKVRCIKCSHVYETSNLFEPCPVCQNYGPDILEGRELRLKSLVVE